jgi:hypothetical protein
VLDMRMGREIRPEMESRLRQFMSNYGNQTDRHPT